MREILIYFAIKYKGRFENIYDAIKRKEPVDKEEIKTVIKMLENNVFKAITIIDDEYPKSLKLINNPPMVLFYKGNVDLLYKKMVIVTGDACEENKKQITKKVKEIYLNDSILVSWQMLSLDKELTNNLLSKNKPVVLISLNGIQQPKFKFNLNESLLSNPNNYLIVSERLNVNGMKIKKKDIENLTRLITGFSSELHISSLMLGFFQVQKNEIENEILQSLTNQKSKKVFQ